MNSFAIIARHGVYREGFEDLCCQFCHTQKGILFARHDKDGVVIKGDIICGGGCMDHGYDYKDGKYVIATCKDCNLPKKECKCITCDDCGELVCECMTCPKCALKESPYDFCNGGCDGCGLCHRCCDETTCIHREDDE